MTQRPVFELSLVAGGRWLTLRVEAVSGDAALACALHALGTATLVSVDRAATPGVRALLSHSPL